MTDTIADRRAEPRGTPDRRHHPRDVFVEFRDVFKAYGSKEVLCGVNLKVYRGEVLVILGGSGTGKSVTLRHMLGLEAPDNGRIIVEEEDITDLPEEELYRVRKKFGMLFQSGALFDSMTVFDNVAFPLREHTDMAEEEIGRAVRDRLELVNLPDAEQLMPVDLSGGMRKRVGLALDGPRSEDDSVRRADHRARPDHLAEDQRADHRPAVEAERDLRRRDARHSVGLLGRRPDRVSEQRRVRVGWTHRRGT